MGSPRLRPALLSKRKLAGEEDVSELVFLRCFFSDRGPI